MTLEHEAGFGALDSMAVGVVITGEDGRVSFANAVAERMLDRADGLSADHGLLQGVDEDGIDLVHHIRSAHAAPHADPRVANRALRIKRAGSASPYLVVLSSVATASSRDSWKSIGGRSVVLFVRDPDHAQETRVELLRRLYGLTGSEARLTDLIASGMPLKTGGRALGLTEATARQYLKQVFRKTCVSGQPDLVRKVMNLPPSISVGVPRPGEERGAQR